MLSFPSNIHGTLPIGTASIDQSNSVGKHDLNGCFSRTRSVAGSRPSNQQHPVGNRSSQAPLPRRKFLYEKDEEEAEMAPPPPWSGGDNRAIVIFGIGVFHAGQDLHDIEIAIPEGRFAQVLHQ